MSPKTRQERGNNGKKSGENGVDVVRGSSVKRVHSKRRPTRGNKKRSFDEVEVGYDTSKNVDKQSDEGAGEQQIVPQPASIGQLQPQATQEACYLVDDDDKTKEEDDINVQVGLEKSVDGVREEEMPTVHDACAAAEVQQESSQNHKRRRQSQTSDPSGNQSGATVTSGGNRHYTSGPSSHHRGSRRAAQKHTNRFTDDSDTNNAKQGSGSGEGSNEPSDPQQVPPDTVNTANTATLPSLPPPSFPLKKKNATTEHHHHHHHHHHSGNRHTNDRDNRETNKNQGRENNNTTTTATTHNDNNNTNTKNYTNTGAAPRSHTHNHDTNTNNYANNATSGGGLHIFAPWIHHHPPISFAHTNFPLNHNLTGHADTRTHTSTHSRGAHAPNTRTHINHTATAAALPLLGKRKTSPHASPPSSHINLQGMHSYYKHIQQAYVDQMQNIITTLQQKTGIVHTDDMHAIRRAWSAATEIIGMFSKVDDIAAMNTMPLPATSPASAAATAAANTMDTLNNALRTLIPHGASLYNGIDAGMAQQHHHHCHPNQGQGQQQQQQQRHQQQQRKEQHAVPQPAFLPAALLNLPGIMHPEDAMPPDAKYNNGFHVESDNHNNNNNAPFIFSNGDTNTLPDANTASPLKNMCTATHILGQLNVPPGSLNMLMPPGAFYNPSFIASNGILDGVLGGTTTANTNGNEGHKMVPMMTLGGPGAVDALRVPAVPSLFNQLNMPQMVPVGSGIDLMVPQFDVQHLFHGHGVMNGTNTR